jgi:hypothetical protein
LGKSRTETQPEIDTDADRYPSLTSVLNKVQHRMPSELVHIERLEVTCLANGDATFRVWAPRAEEPETGFIPSATG